MVAISRKTYEGDGIGILWINEKNIEEELDHKNLLNKLQ